MLEWLKNHWFLFTALVFIGTAWGQQQVKVSNLEDAVKKQVEINQKLDKIKEDAAKDREKTIIEISEIKQQNARIEERLILLVNMQRQVRIPNATNSNQTTSSR